ncbi:MAG: response regulator [Novosphingobium sp.]|uniref:response regulator n=1 Tax=Novosphingobium sp. TaxID=1874826 RepID=UPI003B9B2D1D
MEDDNLVADLLGEMLVEMGHTVCATGSTQSGAVAAAKLHNPDLMIIDLMLREGNGLDAVDLIQQTRHTPYVLVSGDALKVLKQRPNAVAILKPYTEAILVAAMNRALGQVPQWL